MPAVGCRKNPASNRCRQYPGQSDDEFCVMGPYNRCRSQKDLAKAYAPKRKPTAAQLKALAKARAVRAAKKQRGGGGCPGIATQEECLEYPKGGQPLCEWSFSQIKKKDVCKPKMGGGYGGYGGYGDDLQHAGGCRRNAATKRCRQYSDQSDDSYCVQGPNGRCRSQKGLAKAYTPKRKATPAQLAALAKARAAKKVYAAQRGGWYGYGGADVPQWKADMQKKKAEEAAAQAAAAAARAADPLTLLKDRKAAKAAAAAADQAKLDAIPDWKKDLNTKLVTKKTQQSEAARKQAYDKLSATQKMAYDRQHAGYWW